MKSKKQFPPQSLKHLTRQSASNFLALLRDSKKQPNTLIFGAGISASAGLPTWKTLLKKICGTFFCHWEFEIIHNGGNPFKPPKNLSIAFYDEFFWSEEAISLANQFSEENALLVTQQIKNCVRDIDWRYMINKIIYNSDINGNPRIKASKLIENLVRYCISSTNISAIVSYNWDNVFERLSIKNKLNISPIWGKNQKHKSDSIPIYYPHGYLPLGGGPITKLLLAESDYQQEETEIYSWANLIQIQSFCTTTCLFIGTSMTDPNLRRLLRISKEISSNYHYSFLPSNAVKSMPNTKKEVLFDHDLLRFGIKVIRYPIDNSSKDPYSQLPNLVDYLYQHISDESYIWRDPSPPITPTDE